MQNKEKTVLLYKIFRIDVLLNCNTWTLRRFSALPDLLLRLLNHLNTASGLAQDFRLSNLKSRTYFFRLRFARRSFTINIKIMES